MGRARDLMRDARRDIHSEWMVAALYIPVPGATPVPCNVRVHRKTQDPMTGDLSSMDGAAKSAVPEDRVIFYLPELPAIRRTNAIVSVEAGEAYKIEFLYPPRDEWQTARVTPLSAADANGLPVPA